MPVIDYFNKHAEQINHTLTHLEYDQIDNLIELILSNKSALFFTGVGKNGHVAAKAASTFCSIGVPAYFINPVDAMHGDLGMIKGNDLIIAVSKSGNTDELVRFLKQAEKKSAKIVLMHSNAELTFEFSCQSVYVPIQKECDDLNIIPSASIVIFTTLLQSIACELANRSHLTVSDVVLNHPGGMIGQTKITTNNDVKYVIIQAGGQGSRMGQYTANKPKCLVPVNGVTMIENTFRVFSNCKFIVIGDHLYDRLDAYLRTFCSQYDYTLIRAHEKGTAAGIAQALQLIPANEPFALTWSDLFFVSAPQYELSNDILIGLTDDFECRWSMQDNKLVNVSSKYRGVAGFYVFKDKDQLINLTCDQSLVRGFLASVDPSRLDTFKLTNCVEIGQAAHYEQLIKPNRFFNRVDIDEYMVKKTCVVSEYKHLIEDEIAWYKHINYRVRTPQLFSDTPLSLQRIPGFHAFDADTDEERQTIVNNYCEVLHSLHQLEQVPANANDCVSVYETKPQQRLQIVRSLIPHAEHKEILINGRWCVNPLHNWNQSCVIPKQFTLIHGDPTFSNTRIDNQLNVWFIDPRGRFGSTALYGDPAYDWAKFYYSAVGNYDSVNKKKFQVKLYNDSVELQIQSSGYEQFGNQIVAESGLSAQHMQYLHAGIWLSLCGYVTEDLDAIMFAFYQGVYLWNHN